MMPFIALGIGVALAALDQLFKFLIVSNFELGQTRQFIPGILNLTYVRNEGVAFGMFAGMQWVFIVLTTVMLAAIIFYMFKKRPESRFFYIIVGMIIGGGVGNLIDRILNSYVVDYLSLTFFFLFFYFADYVIVVGVILLAVWFLFFSDKAEKKEKGSE